MSIKIPMTPSGIEPARP